MNRHLFYRLDAAKGHGTAIQSNRDLSPVAAIGTQGSSAWRCLVGWHRQDHRGRHGLPPGPVDLAVQAGRALPGDGRDEFVGGIVPCVWGAPAAWKLVIRHVKSSHRNRRRLVAGKEFGVGPFERRRDR